MKQFKKEKSGVTATGRNQPEEAASNAAASHNPIDAINSIAASFNTNGVDNQFSSIASSPAIETSMYTNITDGGGGIHATAASNSSRASLSPTPSIKSIGAQLPMLNMSPGNDMSQAQFKEQLQLHVQTIGKLI